MYSNGKLWTAASASRGISILDSTAVGTVRTGSPGGLAPACLCLARVRAIGGGWPAWVENEKSLDLLLTVAFVPEEVPWSVEIAEERKKVGNGASVDAASERRGVEKSLRSETNLRQDRDQHKNA